MDLIAVKARDFFGETSLGLLQQEDSVLVPIVCGGSKTSLRVQNKVSYHFRRAISSSEIRRI